MCTFGARSFFSSKDKTDTRITKYVISAGLRIVNTPYGADTATR